MIPSIPRPARYEVRSARHTNRAAFSNRGTFNFKEFKYYQTIFALILIDWTHLKSRDKALLDWSIITAR